MSLKIISPSTVYLGSAEGGNGGGGGSSKGQMFDIKIMSQLVAEKGWAFTCKATRQDLAKADIPTVYADIKEKYDNADEGFILSSSTPTTNNGVWYDETTNKYYYANNGHIYSSENIDLSNPTDMGDFEVSYVFIGKNINILVHKNYAGTTFKIYNKSWELIKTITSDLGPQFQIEYFKLVDGYFIFWYSADVYSYIQIISDNENATYRCSSQSLYDIWSGIGTIFKCSDNYDGYVYFTTSSDKSYGGNTCYFKFDLTNFTISQTYGYSISGIGTPYNNGRITISNIVKYNNEFYIANINKVYKSSTLENNSWSEVATLSTNSQFINIIENNGTFYLSANGYIYSTNNFVTFNQLTTFTAVSYGYFYPYNFYVDDNYILLSLKESDTIYVYGSYTKQVSTDTYVIDGNEVEIDYYTKDGFKICLADGTNDTNLATVYSYMGYYNYFVLDVTGETVSLPRNSNLYSIMYVGDNYQDTLTGIPNGQYEVFALKSETKYLIKDVEVSANITVALDKEHKAYKITTPTSDFSLAIDNTNCPIGYEIKDFILIIDMTNSSQAYEVTWANNIQWGNTSPTMTAMVKYMFSFTTIDGGTTWIGNQMFSWQ